MKIVAISDTHGLHLKMPVPPDGDVLVVAGDILRRKNNLHELEMFNYWLGLLPHTYKIVVAGNHDWIFESDPNAAKALTNAIYLQDSGFEIDGVNFWGSPWTPEFYNWAFMLPRGEALAKKWARIPDETDVLITHGPPYGTLDVNLHGERCGCEALADRVSQLPNLKLHLFGHIHYSHGVTGWYGDGPISANCATCGEDYKPVNHAHEFEL